MTLKEIQRALAQKGFNPGDIDGIWGQKTAAAVRMFQERSGLKADGVLGPATLGVLFPNRNVDGGMDDPALSWFQEARRLLGTKEKPGAGSNLEILDWAGVLGIPYKGDDIPWCGLFVGHCIRSTLDREPTPTALLSARAWGAFGVKCKPTVGAVMVFWRNSPGSGLGHVGFYAGEDAGAYRILGGNQSDSVSLAWIDKGRLVDARWPSTVPAPVVKPIIVARTDILSWNEA